LERIKKAGGFAILTFPDWFLTNVFMQPKASAVETVTVKGASVAIYFTPTHKAGKEYPGHTLV